MSISTKKLSNGILIISGLETTLIVSTLIAFESPSEYVTISFEAVLPQDAKKAKLTNPIIYLILILFYGFQLVSS